MSSQQSNVLIRPGTPEQAAGFAHMHAESFKAAYLSGNEARNAEVLAEAARFVTPDRIRTRMELMQRSLANAKTEFFYTASDETGTPAGLIYGYKTDDIQELAALYVAAPYFGTGVAQDLTTAFVGWCDPGRRIELGVVEDNIRAQKFYRKMGFQAVNEPYNSHFAYLPEIKMVLPIREEQ
jgi:RimJ/RimL family protein N-acetyltransferase